MRRIQKPSLARWHRITLPALTIMFGMQILRVWLPYLQYLLGDRLGLSPIQLGLVALLIFATAFLPAWLNRRMGLRRFLLISAGGVGLTRLLAQMWTGDPLGDMVLAMIGMVLFILFLPAYLALVHWQVNETGSSFQFAQAILLGLILDTVLHGSFHTYDFIWQPGIIPLALTVILVLIQGFALGRSWSTAPPHRAPIAGSFPTMLPWLAIGPFLFLQLLVFQNQARLATLTDWSLPVVFGWVLISHLLGLCLPWLWQPGKIGAMAMGFLLIMALWPLEETKAIVSALALLIGQIAAAVLISTILQGVGKRVTAVSYPIDIPHPRAEGRQNGTIVYGVSMIMMVTLIFTFYLAFNLRVPYQNSWLLTLAGLILGLGGVGAVRMLAGPTTKPSLSWTLALPLLLLLCPLFIFLTWRTPTPNTPDEPGSIRVISYNLHNGFDAWGHLDPEALAQVIEAEQPDIVALQEVSRGWALNGSLDMLSWLSRRLDLAYIYAPASDVLWGHAVLSRYPILLVEIHPLPPRDLPLKRGFAYVQIDIGQPEPLQLINTHLHHVIEDSAIRVTQADTILRFISNHQFNQFIMTGDMNGTPNAPEIQRLYEHGFNDVVTDANLNPGYTFSSVQPYKRLDYILIAPDLTSSNVVIPDSTASDHLAIGATLNLAD